VYPDHQKAKKKGGDEHWLRGAGQEITSMTEIYVQILSANSVITKGMNEWQPLGFPDGSLNGRNHSNSVGKVGFGGGNVVS
jgi:hypothetical protein